MKDTVQNELEIIYCKTNELLFENKLTMPLFHFDDVQHSVLSTKLKIQNKNKYHATATIPISALYMQIEYLFVELLNVMIMQYESDNDVKLSSNRQVYKNGRYKAFVNILGFNCTDYSKYGYFIKVDGKVERFCRIHGFKKTWGDVYVSQTYDVSKAWNGSMHSGDIVKCKHTSSTRKYIDADGESVRCTKEHILFCLDRYPEIADEIEQKYGIMRMTTDYVRNIVL